MRPNIICRIRYKVYFWRYAANNIVIDILRLTMWKQRQKYAFCTRLHNPYRPMAIGWTRGVNSIEPFEPPGYIYGPADCRTTEFVWIALYYKFYRLLLATLSCTLRTMFIDDHYSIVVCVESLLIVMSAVGASPDVNKWVRRYPSPPLPSPSPSLHGKRWRT
jgi:hypothetical protein